MIPEHTAVTFVMTIEGDQSGRPIYLAGEGKWYGSRVLVKLSRSPWSVRLLLLNWRITLPAQ